MSNPCTAMHFLLTIIAKHRYKAEEQIPRPNNGALSISVSLLKYNLILIHKPKLILCHFLRVFLCPGVRGKLLKLLFSRLLRGNLLQKLLLPGGICPLLLSQEIELTPTTPVMIEMTSSAMIMPRRFSFLARRNSGVFRPDFAVLAVVLAPRLPFAAFFAIRRLPLSVFCPAMTMYFYFMTFPDARQPYFLK